MMNHPPAHLSNLTNTGWSLEGPYDDSESVRNLPIHASPFQVGRRRDLALTLARPTVSTLHAELAQENGQLVVRDLGSTNGTFVNGNRIVDSIAVKENDLVQFATVPFKIRHQRDAQIMCTLQDDALDRALSLMNFDRLMTERAVTPFFQPIVEIEYGGIVGYEVLGRSKLALLENPREMFLIAKKLNLEVELSVLLRDEGVRACQDLAHCPYLFVNTHPLELDKPGLVDSLRATREICPSQPLILEIHESAVSNTAMMAQLRVDLTDLNMGLAYDDFGAGQTRLNELVEVPPDYLKFDMSLIRGIHKASPARFRMLESLVNMVLDLGIVPLAEGVECQAESDACLDLGFEIGQGFLYGRPAPAQG